MLRFFLEQREVITEAIAIAFALTMAAVVPRPTSTWLGAVERRISWLASRRRLSVVLVGLLALATSAALSLFGHVPYPKIHDEYSYLLAADTFASGRLSNPTHPLWVHFESFHIIQQPTYASKYPPAQGLMLALGQVIGGHPIVGVWISMGLAYAATYWMLLGWLPAWLAMVGVMVAAFHPSMLVWWGWSYWGGAVAMMGGALVFGALRRIVRRPRLCDALLLGVGLAVLANSRPFEGLVVSLPVVGILLGWIAGKRRPLTRVSIGRVGLPILGILTLTGAAMAFYNLRVTGHALHTPYLIHERTYAVAPVFIWQHPRPEPTYRHKVIRDFHLGWALDWHTVQRSASGLLSTLWQKVKIHWIFYQADRYLRIPLTIPLVMVLWVLSDRWPRFALLTCGILLVGLLAETWLLPHYAAPITSLVFVLVLQGLRHLRVWRWRGRPLGQSIVWALVLVALASFPGALVQHVWAKQRDWDFVRQLIVTQLKQDGRRHLVIVRYGPLHSPHHEWVYNAADIDGAQIVWAREMNAVEDRRLLEYFEDRQVWLLEVDQEHIPLHLMPYPLEPRP